MDDDMNIVFNLLDIGAYGYGAGYYFENFELEGIAGDACVDASIGMDGLSLGTRVAYLSGSASFKIGPLEIRLEGYLGGYGWTGEMLSNKGTGGSFIDGIGGGIYFKWN